MIECPVCDAATEVAALPMAPVTARMYARARLGGTCDNAECPFRADAEAMQETHGAVSLERAPHAELRK